MNKNNCYFCGCDAAGSTVTVSGKPDDYKVCPDCLLKNMSAVLGSCEMIAAFDAGYSSVSDWKANGGKL